MKVFSQLPPLLLRTNISVSEEEIVPFLCEAASPLLFPQILNFIHQPTHSPSYPYR